MDDLDAFDGETCLGHQSHICTALIVPIDEHDVPLPCIQHLLVESDKGRVVLCLDYTDDVRIDVLNDLRRQARAGLVDRLYCQFDPANPVIAPCGDDNNALCVVSGVSIKAVSVLSEPCSSRVG